MGDGEPGSDARASPQPTEDTPSMSASSSTASSVADSRELCEAPFDRLPEEIIQQYAVPCSAVYPSALPKQD